MPPCVNPQHLFLGTIADNNADRAAKGRNGYNLGPKPKPSCGKGHVFDATNIGWYIDKKRNAIRRYCRMCRVLYREVRRMLKGERVVDKPSKIC